MGDARSSIPYFGHVTPQKLLERDTLWLEMMKAANMM